MKDLFNDDLFEQATDSEIMESAVCSCIYKKINSKFETWKKFMSADPSKISGFTVKEYLNQLEKTYQDSITFDAVDSENITMNIDSLNML